MVPSSSTSTTRMMSNSHLKSQPQTPAQPKPPPPLPPASESSTPGLGPANHHARPPNFLQTLFMLLNETHPLSRSLELSAGQRDIYWSTSGRYLVIPDEKRFFDKNWRFNRVAASHLPPRTTSPKPKEEGGGGGDERALRALLQSRSIERVWAHQTLVRGASEDEVRKVARCPDGMAKKRRRRGGGGGGGGVEEGKGKGKGIVTKAPTLVGRQRLGQSSPTPTPHIRGGRKTTRSLKRAMSYYPTPEPEEEGDELTELDDSDSEVLVEDEGLERASSSPGQISSSGQATPTSTPTPSSPKLDNQDNSLLLLSSPTPTLIPLTNEGEGPTPAKKNYSAEWIPLTPISVVEDFLLDFDGERGGEGEDGIGTMDWDVDMEMDVVAGNVSDRHRLREERSLALSVDFQLFPSLQSTSSPPTSPSSSYSLFPPILPSSPPPPPTQIQTQPRAVPTHLVFGSQPGYWVENALVDVKAAQGAQQFHHHHQQSSLSGSALKKPSELLLDRVGTCRLSATPHCRWDQK
ncbi:hypothetical protein T439DRAFT_359582 [Meredithblackwellia eburnea MCA 4105]